MGFITGIIMPLFFKFIQRKLQKSFKPLRELSPPLFNLKLVFKYTTTKKFNNPAKLLQVMYIISIMPVLWNYVYGMFLNNCLGNCLTYIHSVSSYNPFTPLGCWMLHWCIQFFVYNCWYTPHTHPQNRFHSQRSRWNFSPGFNNISQKLASLIHFMFQVSTCVTWDQPQF